jgi:membrane protease subunit HflC
MKRVLQVFLVAFALAVLLGAVGTYYVVNETEQVIITQFGKPIGQPITNAGVRFKLPFVQTVNRLEKRTLDWDGRPTEMPTKDKTYLVVDAFASWRISDPTTYFLRLRDERSAQSRLDDIIGSEIRNVVAAHPLIEIVRNDQTRKPALDETSADGISRAVAWPPIRDGRQGLERMVFESSAPKLTVFGIELLNFQFTRLNYNEAVQQAIYQRMISERQQIAERFRSEGQGEAARILGNRERELRTIESEAYRKFQTIRGKADAQATEIYARAYTQSPEAAELFQFVKSLETFQKTLDSNTTVVLTTDSDLFRLLKQGTPALPRAPTPASSPKP